MRRGNEPIRLDAILCVEPDGEVAEWFKAAVLKTVGCKLRGFESLPLRPLNLTTEHPDHGKVPEWSIGAAC